jgi:hypothetical protein
MSDKDIAGSATSAPSIAISGSQKMKKQQQQAQ